MKAALLDYELHNSEPADDLTVYYALVLKDRTIGRRVLHRRLKRGGYMPYEEVGRLAVLLGETAIAEQIIQDLEKNRGLR